MPESKCTVRIIVIREGIRLPLPPSVVRSSGKSAWEEVRTCLQERSVAGSTAGSTAGVSSGVSPAGVAGNGSLIPQPAVAASTRTQSSIVTQL